MKNNSLNKMTQYLMGVVGFNYQQAMDIVVDKDLLYNALLKAVEDYPSFKETYSISEWTAITTFIVGLTEGSANFDTFMDAMLDEQVIPEVTTDFLTYEEDGMLSVGVKVYGMIPEGFEDVTDESASNEEPTAVKYYLVPVGEDMEIEFTDIETKKIRVSWNENTAYIDVHNSEGDNIFEDSVEVESENDNLFVPVKLMTNTFGNSFRLVFENPSDDTVKYALETSKGLGFQVLEIRESHFGTNSYIVDIHNLEAVTGGDYNDYVKILRKYIADGIDIYEMPENININDIDPDTNTDEELRAKLNQWSKESIISWLESNDPNGDYDESEDEILFEDAVDMMVNQLSGSRTAIVNEDFENILAFVSWDNNDRSNQMFVEYPIGDFNDRSLEDVVEYFSNDPEATHHINPKYNFITIRLSKPINAVNSELMRNPEFNAKLTEALNDLVNLSMDAEISHLLNSLVDDITSDYQFDKTDENYHGFLNMSPADGDLAEYSDVWDNMKELQPKFEELLNAKGFKMDSIVYGDNDEVLELIVSD